MLVANTNKSKSRSNEGKAARELENVVEGLRRTGTMMMEGCLQERLSLKSKSLVAQYSSSNSQLYRKGRMTVDDILNADFMAGSDDEEDEGVDEVGV
jgi:hypothetical protein